MRKASVACQSGADRRGERDDQRAPEQTEHRPGNERQQGGAGQRQRSDRDIEGEKAERGLPGVREVPRLDRRLLRLDILEGEIARAAGGEESNDGERDEGEDEKPAPAHAASAPPHDDPCPAVQP